MKRQTFNGFFAVTSPPASSALVATRMVASDVNDDWYRFRISGWSTDSGCCNVPVPQTTNPGGTWMETS